MTGAALQAAGALAAVLLVLGALAHWARRRGLGAPAEGRLRVVAACAVDGRRRAVLLRCDGREALLVTGPEGDTFLGWTETRP